MHIAHIEHTHGSIYYTIEFLKDRFCGFYYHWDIDNHTDDKMQSVSGINIDDTVRFLEESSYIISKWFSNNQFQASASKLHVLYVLTSMCK